MEYPELQGDYDFVVCGTGPAEALIAGAAAAATKKVLVVDRFSEYGGCRQTLNFNHFHELVSSKGSILIDRISSTTFRSGAYCLDLIPSILLSRDLLISIVLRTNSHEMLNFQLIDGLYLKNSNSLVQIPISKSSIFSEKEFSLKHKRLLMKFVSVFIKNEYGHQTDTSEIKSKIDSFSQRPISDFFNELGFDEKISSSFIYFIGKGDSSTNTSEIMKNVQTFVDSIGVYGTSPLLTIQYGAADFPQVFARFAAVHQAMICLNSKPTSIEKVDDLYRIQLSKIGTVTAKHLILSSNQFSDGNISKCYREVIITNKQYFPQTRSIAMIPPNVFGNQNVIFVVQFDGSDRAVPDNQFLIHFCSKSGFGSAVESVLNEIGDEFILFRAQFQLFEEENPNFDGVHFITEPEFSFDSFGLGSFIQEAENVLKLCDSDIPFYPKPTEVLIDVPIEELPQNEQTKSEIDEKENVQPENVETQNSS